MDQDRKPPIDLDELVREVVRSDPDREAKPSADIVLAYLKGAATPEQQREVQDALISSASFRTELLEIAADLEDVEKGSVAPSETDEDGKAPSLRMFLVRRRARRLIPAGARTVAADLSRRVRAHPNLRAALASAFVLAVLAVPTYQGLLLVPELRSENAKLASEGAAAQQRAERSEAGLLRAQQEVAEREAALRAKAVVPSPAVRTGILVWTEETRSVGDRVPEVKILPGQTFQEFGIQPPRHVDPEATYYVDFLDDADRTLYSVPLKGTGFPDKNDPMGVAVATFPVSDLPSGFYVLAVRRGADRQPLGVIRFRVVRSN